MIANYATAEYKITSQYIIKIIVTRVRKGKGEVTLTGVITLGGNTYQKVTHAVATTSFASTEQAIISYVVTGRSVIEGCFQLVQKRLSDFVLISVIPDVQHKVDGYRSQGAAHAAMKVFCAAMEHRAELDKCHFFKLM